jgi:hypothetical protein
VHLVGSKCNWTKMHGIHGIKIKMFVTLSCIWAWWRLQAFSSRFSSTYHPTPPPLCSATQVAPLKESPMQFCTAISGTKDSMSLSSQLSLARYVWQNFVYNSCFLYKKKKQVTKTLKGGWIQIVDLGTCVCGVCAGSCLAFRSMRGIREQTCLQQSYVSFHNKEDVFLSQDIIFSVLSVFSGINFYTVRAILRPWLRTRIIFFFILGRAFFDGNCFWVNRWQHRTFYNCF